MKNEKIITSIIILVFAALFFAVTYSFPVNAAKDVGPAFLPRVYSIALFILCALLFIQGLRDRKNATAPIHNALLVFLAMIVSIIYIALIPVAGFYFITPVIIIVLLYMTEVRKWLTLLSVSIGTTLFIFVFFEKILKVPVPAGMFFS